MKKLVVFLGLFAIVFSCVDDGPVDPPPLFDNHFQAVPMPSNLVTGDPFPTDSTTINGWVARSREVNNLETNDDIINHGWAIWSALNEITDQTNNGQKLRRFETWYTPQDIINAYQLRKLNPQAKLSHVKRNTGDFQVPHQIHTGNGVLPNDPADASVVGFVKYDPTDAEHIYDNNLFFRHTLDSILGQYQGQIANVPNFPNSGVAIKPVFAPLMKKDPKTGYYTFSAWPGDGGNPERTLDPGTSSGTGTFNNNVYITIDGETNPADSIFSINDFIHFKIDSAQAAFFVGFGFKDAKPGDYAVLQGMHVTTREITRWTWQTFWWSQNHDDPYSPSSRHIASLRMNKNLDRAAGHYAMAVAYNMVNPAQPYNGGTGGFEDPGFNSIYAYNPYLEAGFGPTVPPSQGGPTFALGDSIVQVYYDTTYQYIGTRRNRWGMQTNCMSCHGQARYDPSVSITSNGWQIYLTDQYFELDAPYFKNTVKLDFTWSIRGNLLDKDGNPVK